MGADYDVLNCETVVSLKPAAFRQIVWLYIYGLMDWQVFASLG